MEITVGKTELLRELQLFQGIVERKNTIPILANILVEAEDNEDAVKFTATDLEVGLRSRCPATTTKGGSLTLPAKKLFEIIRALPDTKVRLSESSGGVVHLEADRFNSRIQALPRDDFPALPEPREDTPGCSGGHSTRPAAQYAPGSGCIAAPAEQLAPNFEPETIQ